MVQNNPPWADLGPNRAPHILVIGIGKMGQRVIVEAARDWGFNQEDPPQKIKITLVDIEAEKKLGMLINQHPRLNQLASLISHNMDILSGEFDGLIKMILPDPDHRLDLCYICLDDETFSLQTGLRLNHQLRKYRVPIVMRMAESGGLALLIDQSAGEMDSFGTLRIFDLLDQTCTAELLEGGTHEVLARSLHGVYLENGKKEANNTPQDQSLNTWEDLSAELKENNRQLADRIPILLAAAGYRIAPLTDWDAEKLRFQEGGNEALDQVSLMAKLEHKSWCQRKEDQGWRYGEEKDPAKKTNPALQAWEELPESEREKNKEFIRGLPELLARAGFQIENQ